MNRESEGGALRPSYRLTEIGEIPEEWDVVRVKDVCYKPEYGFTESAKDEPLGPKFLRITDIQNGRVNWDTVPYCDCPDTIIEKYILRPGDILFARTGATTGKSYLIENPPEAVYASYLIRLVSREEIDASFLYSVFNSDIYWRQIAQNIVGSSQGGVNASLLSEIEVPLPPLPEQRKIASILSNVDQAIQKTQAIIDQTKRVKQGLMQTLLTKGIGHTRFKDSPLGDIPEEWETRRLSDIADIRSSGVDKKSHIDEISVRLCNYMDVYQNEYIDTHIDFMEATATASEIENLQLKTGDVIITKDSETPDDIAKPTVVIEDLKNVLCGYHLALLRPDPQMIDGIFLSKLLRSTIMNNQFIRLSQGLTRFGISKSSIEETIIFVPPLSEQEHIADILKNLDGKIREEKAYEAGLERVKRGLMQVLLTGKVRVRIDS